MSELLSLLGALAAEDFHSLPEPASLQVAELLLRARNIVDAVTCRVVQANDVRDVTVNECGRQSRSWLVEEHHLSPEDAGKRLRVARALPSHPVLADAFATGDISLDHVSLILTTLGRLPLEVREVAEAELAEAARHADPTSLGRACRELRIRLLVDEDAEAAEQARYASRWCRTSSTFEGMTHLEAMLDPESAASVMAALAALTPKMGAEDERTRGQRQADALTQLAMMALRTGDLPEVNGERPHVTVTIPLSELRDGLIAGQVGTALLNGKYAVSPATARRLACDAQIIPAILGTHSEVLDLGRSSRTWTRAQRRARALQDHGCVFPQCQAPQSQCEIHHEDHWSKGGRTDLKNGLSLCTFHHWLTHHTNWTITRDHNHKIIARRT
jgi:Domain of unknown function (DUF222)